MCELDKKRELVPAQVVLAWISHQTGITAPIIGASKIHHLQEAIAALEIELNREEQIYLEEPNRPYPVLGQNKRRNKLDFLLKSTN